MSWINHDIWHLCSLHRLDYSDEEFVPNFDAIITGQYTNNKC